MGRSAYENPPSRWAGATPVGGDVYYLADDAVSGIAAYLVFHWCPPNDRWQCQGVGSHSLVDDAPLTLLPSLMWNCCGKHGYIRGGAWQDA